eukprot:CAMPEP_0195282098 /NCGR_PEP_ID=MMETSP0707-20130614/1129_1 /TAXON_ID=33640 /ORGANISM="Asterionellopsis glacialis, Strain CCMP134" /LENGTH=239 /DNA_ID=CAMNT_0040341051 /DNA_START=11 /DNA_END=730 /DNA_ORIENTATION=-
MKAVLSLFVGMIHVFAHSTEASVDFSSVQKGGGLCETHADCQNAGKCHLPIQDLMMDKLQEGSCSCSPSYVGPQCEYYCPLKCWHGGTCGFRSDSRFAHMRGELPYQCTCPEGYMGSRCEITYELCPDQQTKCSNGKKCLKDQKGEYICVVGVDVAKLGETTGNRISPHVAFVVVVGVSASILAIAFLALKRLRKVDVKKPDVIRRSSSKISLCTNSIGFEDEFLGNQSQSSADSFEII